MTDKKKHVTKTWNCFVSVLNLRSTNARYVISVLVEEFLVGLFASLFYLVGI